MTVELGRPGLAPGGLFQLATQQRPPGHRVRYDRVDPIALEPRLAGEYASSCRPSIEQSRVEKWETGGSVKVMIVVPAGRLAYNHTWGKTRYDNRPRQSPRAPG